MSDRHVSLYLGSRILSAALNLVSVVVFTRLAMPEMYGDYLVGFALGFMVFGVGFQWLLHAHFGTFAPAHAARQAGALAGCLGLAGIVGILAALGLAAIGVLDGMAAFGIAVLVAGMVVHVGLVELGRARLMVAAVAAASVLRGVLMLAAGTVALLIAQSAPLLLIAIGLAQLVAGLPIVPSLLRSGVERPRRGDIMALLRFGWPLIPALGAGAVAINFDRLLLSHFAGAADVGRYGALADLIRQGFVVTGEAISAAYVSQAKAGSGPLRRAALERAFVTLWGVALLGLMAWLLLGEGVAAVILGPGYAGHGHFTLGLLALGTALLALRAYYFGQAIYFAGSARREVVANLAMLVLAGLGIILVPAWGVDGAAGTFVLAQAGGLIAFLLADRRTALMPVDRNAAMGMVLWCLLTGAVGFVALQLGWWAAALVVAVSAIGMAWRWDLFGAGTLIAQVLPVSSKRQ